MESLTQSQARRLALNAQGFNDAVPKGRVDRRHLRRVMKRLNLLQLDSVPVIIRTQYMPGFSRLGPYDPDLLDRIAYRDDEWFEAWTHEASLLPVADEPLLRWARARSAAGETWKGYVTLAREDPAYIASVLAQVRERGPMYAHELDDPRPRSGEWWGSRSVGQMALDWLFRIGEVGIRRTAGFEKQFDLLDRIIPAEIIDQPTPTEEDAHRELLLRSATAHGVGSAECLVDYYRLPKRPAKARLAELVEDGQLIEVDIEGWKRIGYMRPDAKVPRWVKARALLSPFDPVVWNRPRAEALFNFEYRIEIYVPKAKRRYGYYVLPFLLGENLVARVDLKTDRAAGVLRVIGAYGEPGIDAAEVATEVRAELDRLAEFVGVSGLEIGSRGDLISRLH